MHEGERQELLAALMLLLLTEHGISVLRSSWGGLPGLLTSGGQPQYLLLGCPRNLRAVFGDCHFPSWICSSKIAFLQLLGWRSWSKLVPGGRVVVSHDCVSFSPRIEPSEAIVLFPRGVD